MREYGALDLIEADDRDSNASPWGSEFEPRPLEHEGEGEEGQYEAIDGNNVSNEVYSLSELKEVAEGRGSDTAGDVEASKDGD